MRALSRRPGALMAVATKDVNETIRMMNGDRRGRGRTEQRGVVVLDDEEHQRRVQAADILLLTRHPTTLSTLHHRNRSRKHNRTNERVCSDLVDVLQREHVEQLRQQLRPVRQQEPLQRAILQPPALPLLIIDLVRARATGGGGELHVLADIVPAVDGAGAAESLEGERDGADEDVGVQKVLDGHGQHRVLPLRRHLHANHNQSELGSHNPSR